MAINILFVVIIVSVFALPFASAGTDFGSFFGEISYSADLWEIGGLTRFVVLALAALGLVLNLGLEARLKDIDQTKDVKISKKQKNMLVMAIPVAIIVALVLKFMTEGGDGISLNIEYGMIVMVVAALLIVGMQYLMNYMKTPRKPSKTSSSSTSKSSSS